MAEEPSTTLDNLCLTIELVPQTCWYSNMRKVLSQAEWDKLRKQVYAQYHHQCGICSATGMLHYHEIWHYDDEAHVQALRGLIALCVWCHHVKHIGLAGILATKGKLDFERVIAHFMNVNACSQEVFRLHYKQAFEQWRERSQYTWKTDLGEWQKKAAQP